MQNEVIVATKNKGKMAEFRRILSPFGFVLKSMEDAGFHQDIVEDGKTFAENAKIKAETIWTHTKSYVIADDSGLCIDALDGAPGVYSARYMGEDTTYSVKMAGLLSALSTVEEENRQAYFQSAIAFTDPSGETLLFEGKCQGTIGYAPKGTNGFGYDPIFMVGDKSYAELSNEEKDQHSHRGIALAKLCDYLTKQNKEQE